MTFTLSEAESRRIVSHHGVTVSPFVCARSSDDAVSATIEDDEVKFPVVAKLGGRSIAHKTERGLVRLGIPHAETLRDACDELLAAATEADGPVELLISSMIEGSRELIAGVTRDPQFGPVVMLGLGGIFAEAIADVAFRLVPITAIDAVELIDDLANQRILGPFRGEPAIDRDALAGTLLALGQAVTDEPDIASIDLNPLIISAGRPIAADALIEVTAEVTLP